jgi:hypothetical protein
MLQAVPENRYGMKGNPFRDDQGSGGRVGGHPHFVIWYYILLWSGIPLEALTLRPVFPYQECFLLAAFLFQHSLPRAVVKSVPLKGMCRGLLFSIMSCFLVTLGQGAF